MMTDIATSKDITAGTYSMRVVQRLTGLSPDTIRVWERRYGAVKPKRTAGGTRRFSERDVKRLTLLNQAVERGHRIGAIAPLSDARLSALLDEERQLGAASDSAMAELDLPDAQYGILSERYLDAIAKFDVARASQIMGTAAALFDRDTFLFQIVLPALRKVGDAWEAGEMRVAHEHLVSAQIRGLVDALWRQSTPLPGAPRVVVGTPPGERHEFGAAMAALLAATRGFQVIYLGPDLPWEELKLAAADARADLLVLSLIRPLDRRERQAFSAELRKLSERVDVWLGMPADHPTAGDATGARIFTELEQFAAALTERAARRQPRRKGKIEGSQPGS